MRSGRAPSPAGGQGASLNARARRTKWIPGSRLRAAAVLLVLAAAAAAFLQYGGAGAPLTGAWIVAPSVPEWLQMPDAMPGGAFAQVQDTAFITTWNADSAPYTISIPLEVHSGGTITIDWGDGSTVDVTANGTQSHTYSGPGDYRVSMAGDLSRIDLGADGSTPGMLASIDQWGGIGWTSMANSFRDASNMVYAATDVPDLSGVSSMDGMFRSASSFNGNLSTWDVSSVTDMNSMFFFADDFNQPLDSWNVSSVTDMNSMFIFADDFNQPLDSWNVSSVTDMNSMFIFADAFNQPLDSWNVSGVDDMAHMFNAATSFNQTLNSWNVSGVDDMAHMFSNAAAFNGDISDWDVSTVTNMGSMFDGATLFDGDISEWNVSSVTDMGSMFLNAASFDQNLGEWYVIPADTAYGVSEGTLGVTTISAQNAVLDGHDPNYGIGSGGDSDSFNMTGNALTFKATPSAGNYMVNVTAPGGDFGTGNHHRVLDVTVTGQGNRPPMVTAGGSADAYEGSVGRLEGTAVDPDTADTLTYEWTHNGAQPLGITIADDAALSTTFEVTGDVASDTQVTFTLAVGDGTPPAVTASTDVNILDSSGAFITTWEPTESEDTVVIGVDAPPGAQYVIDWGDGAQSDQDDFSVGTQSHQYDEAGAYRIVMDGNVGSVYQTVTPNLLKSIDQWGDIEWTSMKDAFKGASGMTYKATDAPNLSRVTDMASMFHGAALFDGDISGWDVSGVTDMGAMFQNAADFDQPLDSWDVSGVTYMRLMFAGASDFDQPLGLWNVSGVINMNSMFAGADSFNRPLGLWNVSGVTDMGSMFDGAASFEQNLGEWYVVPDDSSIARSDVPGIVGTISAQNPYLDDQSPGYAIGTGGDFALFEIVNGNELNMTSAETKSEYEVNVTASGTGVFEDGNNWRMLDVTARVSDTTSPFITLNGHATVTITVGEAYDEQGAVCDDDVDPDKAAAVGGDAVDTGTPGVYVITYSCTDAAGNPAAQMSRTVNVVAVPDTTPPVITLNGDATVQVTAGGTYSEQGAVCDDDVDPDKEAAVGGDTVDTGMTGTYTVTYDCTDSSNNAATQVTRTVNVVAVPDTTPPVITLNGDATVQVTAGGTYSEQGAVCDDDVDPDKEAAVGGDTVDTGMTGTYTVTYDCTDSSNNAATQVTRTVNVVAASDTTPPVITLNGDATVQVTAGGTYSEQGAVCDDDVDPDKEAAVGGDTVDTGMTGTYTVTYDCTDSSNNAATQVTRTVNVVAASDTTPPVITLNGDATVQVTAGGTYSEQGAVCDDDVDPDKEAAVGGDAVDTGMTGTYTVTYDCTDSSNNAATQVTRTVNVVAASDTTPPVITLNGDATVQVTAGGTYSEQGAVCDDDVDPDKEAAVGGDAVDTGMTGTYTVTYDCTDSSNNAATQVTRTVNVVAASDTPPTFDSSELNSVTGVLTITFSEEIDATNVVPANIHIRESGNYTHGVTLTSIELGTDTDGATVSFTLTAQHNATVAGLTEPELTIEPGAVRDASGNLIVGTFDTSTLTFVGATSVEDREILPQGMAFSNDGLKMFVIGRDGDDVNEYDLTTPFDTSTLAFAGDTSVATQEDDPTGMAFSNDGLKMFVIGYDGDDVNEYDLTAAFDTSTLAFAGATSIKDRETKPQGMAFSNDGLKMFVIGHSGDDVTAYNLDAAFDPSTLTHVGATSIKDREKFANGMAFSNDGLKMFVIGSEGDDVNEYDLTTPFDPSTLAFAGATSVSAQDSHPTGMAFSNDGSKMFVIGSDQDKVNEYDLHSVYPIVETYTVFSNDADLSALAISPGTLSPTFSDSTTAYTAGVANSVTEVTVTPTASDGSATITVNDNAVTSNAGYLVTGLTVGDNPVTVEVTAQDSTTKTYAITVTRAAADSNDADLSALAISPGTLSPTFSDSTTAYTAGVANSVTEVTVTPTASDGSATITVNDNAVTSNAGYLVTGLTVGDNPVTVEVTAQDSTTKTYAITVTRAAADSNDADLSALAISPGTLSPTFSDSTTAYTAGVANSVTEVTVTPTASDGSATITVNDNAVTSNAGYLVTGLTVGDNPVTVEVTAQDSTTKTYAITVTRAAADSNDADLSALAISPGTLSPTFSDSTTAYTAGVANSVTEVTVTPTASDGSATITVNDNAVTSNAGYLVTGLTVGDNPVTVEVTAQDSTTKTYAITVTRAAADSNDADLSALAISPGTLSPTFSDSTTAYTAGVANSVTEVTVTPTASDGSATITVNDNAVTSNAGYLVTGLTVGDNPVTVEVTAQDSTTKTYAITVTRAAADSNDADLSALAISPGTLSPTFSDSTTAYTAGVANSVTEVTVTPTASDGSATITVNDNAVTSNAGYLVTGLTVGDNPVTVEVTAQDSTTKTYAITVTRAAAGTFDATITPPASPTNQDPTFGVTFGSDVPAGQFTEGDVDTSPAGLAVSVSGSGTSFSFTITGAPDGMITAHIQAGAVSDAGGDSNAASNRAVATVDKTDPQITSARASGSDTITVSFSERVQGSTAASDWSLGGAPGVAVDSATGLPGGSVTLGLSEDLPEDRPELTLDYTGTGILDLAGNPLGVAADIAVSYPSSGRSPESSGAARGGHRFRDKVVPTVRPGVGKPGRRRARSGGPDTAHRNKRNVCIPLGDKLSGLLA